MTLANTLVRRALFLALTGAVIVGSAACQPRHSAPTSAQAFASSDQTAVLSLLNGYRTANGLSALAVAGDATAKAQQHSDEMASQGTIFHSSSLSSGIDAGWTMLGENVGVAGSADQCQSMFQSSGPHNDNMLNPAYDQVGIGVTRGGDGRLYITQFFVSR